jgi:hypothetical protein
MKIRTTLLAKTSALIAAAALSATVCALLSGTATAAEKAPRGAPIQPLGPGAAVSKPSVAAKAAETDGEFAVVGFDKLSTFKYEVPDDVVTNAPAAVLKDPDQQIPATVKAYNGKRVSLKGFMLPLKVEGGLVTELLIMRDQSMCCYGAVPKINEWVSVKMTSKGVKPVMDQAVTLSGTLKVGAIRENGYLVGIYQMDGEKMNAPGM